jgi:hypothetical protein
MARLVLLPRRRSCDAWDRPTAPAPAFLQARCPGSPRPPFNIHNNSLIIFDYWI